jgi:hypothetical protein
MYKSTLRADQAAGFQGFDGAGAAKRPKRREGAPKAPDGDGAMGPSGKIEGLKYAENDFEEIGSIISDDNQQMSAKKCLRSAGR